MKNAALTGAGAIVALSAALWFFLLQPEQQNDVKQAGELLELGINLYNEKKFDEALDVLQRISSGSAEQAKALYYQGSAHMLLKNYEAAAVSLEQSLALNTQHTGTLYALGVTYFKLGNVKLAKGYFASVLEINPNDQQAKGLMDIMAGLERQSGAESEGDDATEIQ